MERYRNDRAGKSVSSLVSQQDVIPVERFFKKLPSLAITGDDQSVDRIAYELLNLLLDSAGADIGQINLLPRGGRVEKVCIVKDGRPWLRSDMGLHPYNPGKGFTGRVISTGKTLLVEDIWAEAQDRQGNPFLAISPFMDQRYLEEIKRPVASTLILPIKRNNEIFCTIELSRYRYKAPFTVYDQVPLDEFAAQYGAVIINYILDTKNRIALNTAYSKLNNLSRLIASSGRIDYSDAVTAYRTLSAADLGFAFFRRGEGYSCHHLYLVAWRGEEIREISIPDFTPSADSVLCNSSEISFPVEGDKSSRRLQRFRDRIVNHEDIEKNAKDFIVDIIDRVRSYVVYPLHMLNQDLGAIHLASSRNDFCSFLHMSPFLSLYNALLKSFLLNERVADLLSQVSLKVHNPGFYCLGGLKGALLQESPKLLNIPGIASALNCLDDLMTELHEKGKILNCRPRNIQLQKWLGAWIDQKRAHHPNIQIHFNTTGDVHRNAHVRATYEHIETIFENLIANSLRAILERQSHDRATIGRVDLVLAQEGENLAVLFQDNGEVYTTVSGRGTPQMRTIMEELGGRFTRDTEPYRVCLTFPCVITRDEEVRDENQGIVSR